MLFDRSFDVSTRTAMPFCGDAAERTAIEQFLFHEARLLDTRDFDAWLALWAPDGMYWVPHELGQSSPHDHISLFWEDRTLREVRVRRLRNARNWSQQPPTRTARLIGNIMPAGTDDAGRLVVHSTFQLTEWRRGPRQMAGHVTHKLVRADEAADGGAGWRIVLKRVDLLGSTDVWENMEVFI